MQTLLHKVVSVGSIIFDHDYTLTILYWMETCIDYIVFVGDMH